MLGKLLNFWLDLPTKGKILSPSSRLMLRSDIHKITLSIFKILLLLLTIALLSRKSKPPCLTPSTLTNLLLDVHSVWLSAWDTEIRLVNGIINWNKFRRNLTFCLLFLKEGKPYLDAVFNETVSIVELEEGLDGETFFLYVLMAAFVVLLLVIGQHLLSSYGPRKAPRKQQIERG